MHDGKVWITDWHDNRHEMTPAELLERIRKDSQSHWNWLAPANEIVKTVTDSDFPEPIANELKGRILKCFAEILLSDIAANEKPTDQLAVAYCYYSLHGKAGKRAKRLYRQNLVQSVIKDSFWIKPYDVHGDEWRAFCTEWKRGALQHFTKRFGTDFMRFRANIKADFKASIKRADKAGLFENDKAEAKKSREELIRQLADCIL